MKKLNNEEFNKKFDIDLKRGKIFEEKIQKIFGDKKLEVKSEDARLWAKTGNIAIEYEFNGKPSGIEATESDYWVHVLHDNEKPIIFYIFPVDLLRYFIQEEQPKTTSGGDNNLSKMYLIPICDLIKYIYLSRKIMNNECLDKYM